MDDFDLEANLQTRRFHSESGMRPSAFAMKLPLVGLWRAGAVRPTDDAGSSFIRDGSMSKGIRHLLKLVFACQA